jgi:hypothetical protein
LRHLDRAEAATCAHRRDAGDELDLADWARLDRPIGAIHRAALLEDGGDDVVAGVEIGEQFRQQVGPAAAVPQMMMRIDDRQLRFEDRLFLLFCQPRIVGLAAMTKPAWLNGLRHGDGPMFADVARISRARGGHRLAFDVCIKAFS